MCRLLYQRETIQVPGAGDISKPSDSHRWKAAFCPSSCTDWKRIRANPTAAARFPDTGKICLKEMASASGVG